MNTKKLARLTGVLAVSALISPACLNAQTFETVLDYQYPGGQPASAGGDGLAADAAGNVFAGGSAYDAAGNGLGLVFGSSDPTVSWPFADTTNPNASQYDSAVWNLGTDSSGNLYSVGQLTPQSTGVPSWQVQKWPADGSASTFSLYQYTAGQWADATGFAADNAGNVYVAGGARDLVVTGSGKHQTTQSNNHWLVRRSSDGGASWANVDDVVGPSANGIAVVPGAGVFAVGGRFIPGSWQVRRSVSGNAGTWSNVDGPYPNGAARAVTGDGQGNIFVAGTSFVVTGTVKNKGQTTQTGYYGWTTRMSADGGSTWAPVDSDISINGSGAWGIGRDAAGHVVVVGTAPGVAANGHWIVRSRDDSGTWQTIDDYQLVAGNGASASSVVTDAAGNLYVAGSAHDATGDHWIVRRLAASAP